METKRLSTYFWKARRDSTSNQMTNQFSQLAAASHLNFFDYLLWTDQINLGFNFLLRQLTFCVRTLQIKMINIHYSAQFKCKPPSKLTMTLT